MIYNKMFATRNQGDKMKIKSETNMLSGSIVKGLISMSIPVMIMNVSQSLFSVIDMTVLGNLVDDTAVGAVGACGMLITLITGLLIGISTGANVVVAKHLGSKDNESAEKAIGVAILFGVFGGCALLIIGVIFAEYFLKLTNCPDDLLGQAVTYFRLYFCGVPVIMLYNFCASILRAKGDTKRPMMFLMLGGAVKVVLNFFLITVFHTSVEGVAIATVVANLIAGGLSFYVLLHSEGTAHFRFKHLKFYPAEIKSMLFIGIPAGLQTALYSLANVIIVSVVNSYGTEATTGISIANQFDGILYQICCATAFVAMPYIAQNVGAKNFKRVKQTVIRAMLVTIAFGASFGALSAIFSGQLSSLMSDNPVVIQYSQQKMNIISSTYFICGISEIMCATMRGLGKPIVPTVATLMFMCVLRFVWVYLIYPLCPNFTFLYLVWPVGWILCIITMLVFYFPTMSKLEKNICVEENKTQASAINM